MALGYLAALGTRLRAGVDRTLRPGLYSLIIITLTCGVFAFTLRRDGVFACQAAGYSGDRYLSYCQSTRYGDYDHGAFWFGLEPHAVDAASQAQVLFLGNSRTQLALSTSPLDSWFRTHGTSYYLLGFSHMGNYRFTGPLLTRLRPKAQVYIINLDRFFEADETPPAQTVMHDVTSRSHYAGKRSWQPVHRTICQAVARLCGDEYAFFRARGSGAWILRGGPRSEAAASFEHGMDEHTVATYSAAGRAFLAQLPVQRSCVLFTMAPTVGTPIGTGRAIADSLGVTFVAPELAGLRTFDGSHMDDESAARWSEAFIAAVGPLIRSCITTSANQASSRPGQHTLPP